MENFHEVYTSNNGQFLLGTRKTEKDKMSEIVLYDMESQTLKIEVLAPYEMGGMRAAVSETGKYIVSASYSHKGVSLFDGETGNELWNIRDIKKVQRLAFSNDEKYVLVSNDDAPEHTYYVTVESGEIVKRMVASKVLGNSYGEEIVFWHQDILLLSDKKIKSPTFSFLTACGTPYGIVVSPVLENLRMYDYDGNRVWKTRLDIIDHKNHIVKLSYNKERDRIYACSWDGVVHEINPESGDLLSSKDIRGRVFVNGASAILDKDGEIHSL